MNKKYLCMSTLLVAGQMAVFSSFEKDDLQIEEYPSLQGTTQKKTYRMITFEMKKYYSFQQLSLW